MGTVVTATYYVVCFCCGASYGARPGSELEERCKRRAAREPEPLDALILAPGECPNCIERERREIRQGYDMDVYMDDPNPPKYPEDSPIDDQLVGLPAA